MMVKADQSAILDVKGDEESYALPYIASKEKLQIAKKYGAKSANPDYFLAGNVLVVYGEEDQERFVLFK